MYVIVCYCFYVVIDAFGVIVYCISCVFNN